MSDFKSMLEGLAKQGITVADDVESQPEALKGQYLGEVKGMNVFEKEGGGKVVSFNIQIVQTMSGNKGDKRYLNKKYTVFCECVYPNKTVTAEENLGAFLSGLKSMGIYNETMNFNSEEELLEHAKVNCVGKSVNLSTWPQTDMATKEVKRDAKGWPKQNVKFISQFTKIDTKEAATSASPF
jgi:hypothetical protein